jgi:peptidoglycan hydrolase-like protein with peptidoglycan-binding domain
LSYSKAVTGWCRAAATFILFFLVTAGTAAAAGLGPTSTTPTTPSTTPTKTGSGSTKYSNAAFGKRLLSVGMSGSDVLALQHDLTALGFSTPTTGRFTLQTEQRLKAFQRRYGLSVDGVAGPSSIGTLKRLLSAKLHITETAVAAKELASGKDVVASKQSNLPLPAGDTGITGGVGLGPEASNAVELNATLVDGVAVPAPGTPLAIVTMLDAANKIAFDPYIYGGGHKSFNSRGYDCSGSVSYVLHAGDLLATPLDSEQFLKYGLAGKGNWITVYTNGPTHAYMEIAGLWFDTAAQTAGNGNDRWSTTRIGEPGYGKFLPRHPSGW